MAPRTSKRIKDDIGEYLGKVGVHSKFDEFLLILQVYNQLFIQNRTVQCCQNSLVRPSVQRNSSSQATISMLCRSKRKPESPPLSPDRAPNLPSTKLVDQAHHVGVPNMILDNGLETRPLSKDANDEIVQSFTTVKTRDIVVHIGFCPTSDLWATKQTQHKFSTLRAANPSKPGGNPRFFVANSVLAICGHFGPFDGAKTA